MRFAALVPSHANARTALPAETQTIRNEGHVKHDDKGNRLFQRAKEKAVIAPTDGAEDVDLAVIYNSHVVEI